MCVHLDAVHE
jgi:hypothetical protein